jgi:hypothetical protein
MPNSSKSSFCISSSLRSDLIMSKTYTAILGSSSIPGLLVYAYMYIEENKLSLLTFYLSGYYTFTSALVKFSIDFGGFLFLYSLSAYINNVHSWTSTSPNSPKISLSEAFMSLYYFSNWYTGSSVAKASSIALLIIAASSITSFTAVLG